VLPTLPAPSTAPEQVTVNSVGPPLVTGVASMAIPEPGSGSTALQPATGTEPAA
jgi:hypothetical protein